MEFAYTIDPPEDQNYGLVALQSDETIEQDFRQLFGAAARLYVTRVPSGAVVTPESLQAMEAQIPTAAGLLPPQISYQTVGYGCTSGTAQIGPARVAELIAQSASCSHQTEPVSALVAACQHLGLSRIAFLSPYIADVSDQLRSVLSDRGVASPVFGSFNEAREARVARISEQSIVDAAQTLVRDQDVDAIFLSCTNLRTLGCIDALEQTLGIPVLSSNLVLFWHMAQHGGATLTGPGRLINGSVVV
jgi:maleate isomerase